MFDVLWCGKKGTFTMLSKRLFCFYVMKKNQYSDRDIVEGILSNNPTIIEHFFFRECKPLFVYIIRSVFDGGQEINELVNEFYLYLQHDDWCKVRQFDYRSKLLTWMSVVAIRFFQKKRMLMIEFESIEALYDKNTHWHDPDTIQEHRMDVKTAINKMPNERYRYVIEELELKERDPEELALEMNISVDNLYNIRRRARLQLKTIMVRKEDYYD